MDGWMNSPLTWFELHPKNDTIVNTSYVRQSIDASTGIGMYVCVCVCVCVCVYAYDIEFMQKCSLIYEKHCLVRYNIFFTKDKQRADPHLKLHCLIHSNITS